jgi:CheY-like chemotaxis protein
MSAQILVVDDEPDVADLFRQQFRRELRSGRLKMDFALSASEALDRLADAEETSLIFIFSDINMPGETGLQLLPKVRALKPNVPVVMITAYGDADTRRKAQEGGAADLVTKPIDFSDLRQRIDQRLAERGQAV